MAYQETNDLLNLPDITSEDQAATNEGLAERERLRASGEYKRIADRIRSKPAVKR